MGGLSVDGACSPEALADLDFLDALESFFFFAFFNSGAVSSFGVFALFLGFFVLTDATAPLLLCVSSCVIVVGF